MPLSSPLAKARLPGHHVQLLHLQKRSNPLGRRAVSDYRHHSTLPRLRVRSTDLAERGVERVPGRVTGVARRPAGHRRAAGRGRLDRSVVHRFPTGLRLDRPPGGREDGWPLEYRGEVAAAPGLFFCGLCFQSTAASMTIHGAGRDAAHVARLIEGRGRSHRRHRSTGLPDPAVGVRRPRRGRGSGA